MHLTKLVLKKSTHEKAVNIKKKNKLIFIEENETFFFTGIWKKHILHDFLKRLSLIYLV